MKVIGFGGQIIDDSGNRIQRFADRFLGQLRHRREQP
jgi:hypothetical protein